MKDDCPVCPKKKVFTKEDFDEDFLKYLNIVKPEQRANNELFRKRLAICEACEYKDNGTCTMCGCMIKIRCILKSNSCPAKNKRW